MDSPSAIRPPSGAATLANARLVAHAAVEHVDAGCEDDVDGVLFEVLRADVGLEALDDDSAAALVADAVMSALCDVVGDCEISWTSHPWTATSFPAG